MLNLFVLNSQYILFENMNNICTLYIIQLITFNSLLQMLYLIYMKKMF